MGADKRKAPTPPMAPGTDSNDTAAEWARRRGRQWVTRYVDVIGGFARRLDFTEILLRLLLASLAVYAVYLALCESCKSEYYEFITHLWSALVDFASLSRGETSAAVVFSLIVWLLTVKFMRGSSPIYLIDFKTYRHKVVGGPEENTAGCPVVYERFFEESKLARHPDGSKCFTERSLEFQEKITRTSCISEDSIFPETIFASEKPGYWGKDAEKKALNMQGARDEAEAMMCKAVEDLLKATGTRAQDIGVLVVNCSLFCPTPSLSAMLVNRFKVSTST